MPAEDVSESRIEFIYEVETKRFHANRPRSRTLLNRARSYMPNGVPCAWMDGLYFHDPIFAVKGEGAYFWDADGHRYLDMNQADLSMNCGYGPTGLAEVIAQRVRDGTQFLLPVEQSIDVCSALSERYGLPFWQFTLSASSANTEVIRIARAFTDRECVLVFDGKYHGHIDDTLYEDQHRLVGHQSSFGRNTISVPFNNLEAVESAFKKHSIACILTEPALTNIGVIRPIDGFLEGLKNVCEKNGALLILDETHTQVCAWGGLKKQWSLESDMMVLGKSVAAGIPVGAYGMSREISDFVANHIEVDDLKDPRSSAGSIALGGTLYGNALSISALNFALNQVLTKDAYAKAQRLGTSLSTGLQQLFDAYGFNWAAQELYTRSGYTFGPEHPHDATSYEIYSDPMLHNAMRVFYANRGVWDAISSAGPAVSFAMTDQDVELYLEQADAFLNTLKH